VSGRCHFLVKEMSGGLAHLCGQHKRLPHLSRFSKGGHRCCRTQNTQWCAARIKKSGRATFLIPSLQHRQGWGSLSHHGLGKRTGKKGGPAPKVFYEAGTHYLLPDGSSCGMSWMVFEGGTKQEVSDCPSGYSPNWHCGDLGDCSTAQTNADGSLTYGVGITGTTAWSIEARK
jgi:hypothetical protein